MQGQSSPQDRDVTPEPVVHLPQNRLVPLLLQQTGDADIRYGHSINAAHQGDGIEGVVVNGRCSVSGEAFEVKCDYLVAADGANSPLRCERGNEPQTSMIS